MEAFEVHGIVLPIAPDEVSPVIWAALKDGSYEAKEARSVLKAIKPGDRVLELGSGIGIITSIIAGIEDVSVWAFEANPSTASLAERVIAANGRSNVSFSQGLLTASEPRTYPFYVRRDLWMSSMDEKQGPYESRIEISSENIDDFIFRHRINALVMDIEGAECDLLQHARMEGVERIFVELHDHLYGLEGVRTLTKALADKGYAYDPRGSRGPCVLFAKDDGPREYEPEVD
ncbi:FkbM family methyltransferase [Agrobacterium larrymoorei]|uniref:FkbM family methyltransferase n=1 Tax=Agrobacterium larrymoorei TaxID=160699 RepID=UPI0015745A1F|nr:FkbM family methyltransferase [Agrobacterium larrymoorei]NTJ41963.1 FkbM family methyltransferase [Agrobacterium larrymoorei]